MSRAVQVSLQTAIVLTIILFCIPFLPFLVMQLSPLIPRTSLSELALGAKKGLFPDDPEPIIRFGTLLLVLGFGLLELSYQTGGVGLATGAMLVGAGASGMPLRNWRTQDQIWALAKPLSFVFGFIQSLVLAREFVAMLSAVPAVSAVLHGVDFAIASAILSHQVRFLTTVFRWHEDASEAEDVVPEDSME